jgi:hypothetical protein
MANPATHATRTSEVVKAPAYNLNEPAPRPQLSRPQLRNDSALFIGALIQHLQNLRRAGARGERDIGCPMLIAKELQQHTLLDIAFQYFDIQAELKRLKRMQPQE